MTFTSTARLVHLAPGYKPTGSGWHCGIASFPDEAQAESFHRLSQSVSQNSPFHGGASVSLAVFLSHPNDRKRDARATMQFQNTFSCSRRPVHPNGVWLRPSAFFGSSFGRQLRQALSAIHVKETESVIAGKYSLP
ncbi:MAG: hypothetical protein EXS18_05280 [Verrucomicrobiae bacterium]|nr:hypothetical protein [Verrucomicrobiae bacterium]